MDISQILGSGEYTMLLLRTYSELYLEGKAPGTCASCMRSYHDKIIKDGKMKAKLKEEVDRRTCVPIWSGLRFIQSINKNGKAVLIHKHISSITITDIEAIELLKFGALSKKDFKVLPEGFEEIEAQEAKKTEVKKVETEIKKEVQSKVKKQAKKQN